MFYHILDHKGLGTIQKLLNHLCYQNSNHKLISYDNINEIKKIANDTNAYIIIHSTANKKSNFIYDFLKYFKNQKIYIFMHVSLNYEIYKGRSDVIDYLKYLSNTYNIIVLTPSKEVTQQYLKKGITAQTIQLGINLEKYNSYKQYRPDLSIYYNKIITTCSSDNDVYKYIKGIDLYENFIFENNLIKYSLVAGTDNCNNTRIFCKRFSEDDFLNILSHSIMYIQFSRFESYNITAIYAKRFKIPVLLMNTEGTFSCMNGNVYENTNELILNALNILKNGPDINLIESLYNDSIIKESLDNFKIEIENLIRKN